jgi:uncharacterized repeat protein (TIGR03803 family)
MQQIKKAVRVGKSSWWKTACAVCVLCATMAIALQAQTFTTLVNFDGTNGDGPAYMSLVQGTDGNLYGTTEYGGANGYGTVFKVTPTGTLTTLYSFCVQTNCTDGAYPYPGLVLGTDGQFYGTTNQGGANNSSLCYDDNGCGTVFKIAPSGKLTTIYNFCARANCTDGYYPWAALIQATNGSFYGTSEVGGANDEGTVFSITSGGALTTLHSFDGTDGGDPIGALVQATGGNFYGTTASGGANEEGTVFSITSGGALTTLHTFDGTDGNEPFGALVQATNGTFYGTTELGGAHGFGTVFSITSGSTLTTLYSFCAQTNCNDGEYPTAALVQATNGKFYGTTYYGGPNTSCNDRPGSGCGTVFSITAGGIRTTLHSFGLSDGAVPFGGLVQATNGTLYGTTFSGGANDSCGSNLGCGTVFSLAVGLGPFVKTLPTSGKVGAVVKILGTNLTGATSVTFNGTPAVFNVMSSSFITTTVPAGATTGTVQVVTPGGTLSSNVSFGVEH